MACAEVPRHPVTRTRAARASLASHQPPAASRALNVTSAPPKRLPRHSRRAGRAASRGKHPRHGWERGKERRATLPSYPTQGEEATSLATVSEARRLGKITYAAAGQGGREGGRRGITLTHSLTTLSQQHLPGRLMDHGAAGEEVAVAAWRSSGTWVFCNDWQ